MAEASVVVRVDASKAIKPLNDVGQAATKAKGNLDRVSGSAKNAQGSFARLKSAGSSLQGVLAALGAGAVLKGLIGAGVEAERTGRRLKLLSESFGESQQLAEFAAAAAEKFAIGNASAASSVADLYGRLRPAGVSLKEIQTTFNGVNVAAARMNLSAADTEGVMLQLSQALGSGTLQGDEFRSVMERLPAIGQAIAKSLGVTVGELKQLGADGALTTEVVINALQGLADQEPPKPDAYKLFNKALADLSTTIGQDLLPAFTPLVQFAANAVSAFSALPGPIQTVVAGVVALTGAVVILAPTLAITLTSLKALGALGIGATIAGWLPVIAKLGVSLGAMGKILIGVFSGPVGWVALAVAAGAAIYKFRDQIGDAFKAIGNVIKKGADNYKRVWIDPVISLGQRVFDTLKGIFAKVYDVLSKPFQKAWDFVSNNFLNPIGNAVTQVIQNIQSGWTRLGEILSAPFRAAASVIRSILNNIIGGVENVINGMINAINRLVGGANRISGAVGGPQIPTIPNVSFGRFADGGVVDGPTLGLIGEGGEREYIIPESKAPGFASNYLQGQRGIGAIPGFAEGGVVGPINIQTGPVMQQDGRNFVTVEQFTQGMSDLASTIASSSRSYGGRRYMGVV